MNKHVARSLLIASMVVYPHVGLAAWATNGNIVSSLAAGQIDEVIGSDGAGGAIVVWGEFNGSDYDIYAQRINASGAVLWTSGGVALCTAAGNQEFAGVVSDGAGGAIITWQDTRLSSNNDIYAQRINAAGVVQWTANGVAICTQLRGQDSPTIIGDGSGGAIITWQDNRSVSNEHIYAQRINAAGAVQWTGDGVAICVATGNQNFPAPATDGAAGAIIVWADFRSGISTDVYAQRVNASGTVQWTANGVVISAATNDQLQPVITADAAGGAIIAWADTRFGFSNSDLYAQRVNSTGAVQWTVNGVALCNAADNQYTRAIATDGAGGAILAWWDRRTGAHDVYARRINAAGTALWTADGVALCTAADEQGIPAIAPDGAGGAIVTWHDERVYPDDIYAQRVDASGAVQWTGNGVAVCTAADDQISPVVTTDGAGGAIFAWQDLRSGINTDIYAQRISGSGAIPTAVSGLTPALPLIVGRNYPNPFAAETSFDVTTMRESMVSIEVFDVAGRRVRSINVGRIPAGETRLTFDGRNDRARALPSGVYFFRVHAGGETVTQKMVIAR